ncbi:cytidine deaminase [Flavobacteriales bacterium]|jgi:cytidine deaminase|nr:cytidine deaminase [Flavobacteriales bacterium]MDB4088833.1 cytidine deaminase [Flavobacteriales bacterium]
MSRTIKHIVELSVVENVEALSKTDRELMMRAKKVSETAYAPYSQFYVGAAIRLSSNEIIEGSNQENMAYPSGMCAERVAIYYANSFHTDVRIDTIAITAHAKEFKVDHPIAPCGACRQSMAEYELKQKHPIRLIMTGESGEVYIAESVEMILPFMFNEIELKKK